MADVPSIDIKVLFDDTRLKSGTADAERSIEDLAREVDSSSDSINQSLKSMDDGVSSTIGSGGTFDASTDQGVDSMKEMASTAREEVPAAMLDMRDGVTGAAEGIAQAMASLGPGGTVVASVIAGFVVMKGRAEAAAQAMRDRVNEAFSAIEVKAKSTNKAIERMYEKQLLFEQTLERFGGGDATKGYERIAGYAKAIGAETEDVVAYIQNRQTPGAEKVAALLARQGDILREQGVSLAKNQGTLTSAQVAAGTLTRFAQEEATAREITLNMARDARDFLRDNKEATEDTAKATVTSADAMERAAAAAERIDRALANAARNSGNVNVAGD